MHRIFTASQPLEQSLHNQSRLEEKYDDSVSSSAAVSSCFGDTSSVDGQPNHGFGFTSRKIVLSNSPRLGLDTLSSVSTSRTPIFVAEARDSLDCIFSVFIRRHQRLPEPGEILFCSADMSLESVELLFRRFLRAREYGRADTTFVLADIHLLSYPFQAAVLERLRQLVTDRQVDLGGDGYSKASTLLLVSALPLQLILTVYSDHLVKLVALDTAVLKEALKVVGMACL